MAAAGLAGLQREVACRDGVPDGSRAAEMDLLMGEGHYQGSVLATTCFSGNDEIVKSGKYGRKLRANFPRTKISQGFATENKTLV